MKSAHEALSVAPLFQGVDLASLEPLLATRPVIRLDNGQLLFDRGDAGGVMFVLVLGRIEISALTESGRKIVLNLIEPGGCFGEIAMYDGRDRTARAVAAAPSVVLPIARATFIAAMEQSPVLARNLIGLLCERVRWTSNSVEDYALLPLDRRLAKRILTLRETVVSPDGSISIPQSDLADFVGASREATNKILMQWKAMGVISIGRRKISLLKAEKLDAIAFSGEI
jgi:CRP/FNR family transcriptional regulator, cyclic AMP receptor protein